MGRIIMPELGSFGNLGVSARVSAGTAPPAGVIDLSLLFLPLSSLPSLPHSSLYPTLSSSFSLFLFLPLSLSPSLSSSPGIR